MPADCALEAKALKDVIKDHFQFFNLDGNLFPLIPNVDFPRYEAADEEYCCEICRQVQAVKSWAVRAGHSTDLAASEKCRDLLHWGSRYQAKNTYEMHRCM